MVVRVLVILESPTQSGKEVQQFLEVLSLVMSRILAERVADAHEHFPHNGPFLSALRKGFRPARSPPLTHLWRLAERWRHTSRREEEAGPDNVLCVVSLDPTTLPSLDLPPATPGEDPGLGDSLAPWRQG